MRRLTARQILSPGADIPRHRHAAPYAALVLSGGYVEAGDSGRSWARPGAVLVHDAFHAHLNRSVVRGTQVLNIELPTGFSAAIWTVADADAVVVAAERDQVEAVALILEGLRSGPREGGDWTDDLATALQTDGGLCLGAWARSRGLAAETLSRGFSRVFGVTPSRFRQDARARRAWWALAQGDAALAAVAADAGFADQAHMNRAVKMLTGRTPGAWRASRPFKTAG